MACECRGRSLLSEWCCSCRQWLSSKRQHVNRWFSLPACCQQPHTILPACFSCSRTQTLTLTRTTAPAAQTQPTQRTDHQAAERVATFDLVETDEDDEDEDVAGTSSTAGATASSSRMGRTASAVRTASNNSRPTADVGTTSGMAGSRSSVSSMDSERHGISMHKRWTMFETAWRSVLLVSLASFLIGVLLTIFGFLETGVPRGNKLAMQIAGPVFLGMTVVLWGTGGLFSRMFNMEFKRQQQAIELRDRVQLHALAMDILNRPVLPPHMLEDARLRRHLMMKLKQHKTLDMSSEIASRRSSRAVSIDSRRRQSSACGSLLHQDTVSRKSCSKDVPTEDNKGLSFELPGIHISRTDTLDPGDFEVPVASGSGGFLYGITFMHENELTRLSCPSDYSLAGSTSRSRSRSSRASSGVSSRLWDFSPRDSEWDADVSLGSRDSQLNVSKQDWGGGPNGDYTLFLSTAPRKIPVVKFDMSSPLRRHSSPASAGRRKDSGCECTCAKGTQATEYPSVLKNRDMSCQVFKTQDEIQLPCSSMRKRSADQSFLSVRIDEDERELDVDETTPLRSNDVTMEERRPTFPQRNTYYTHQVSTPEEVVVSTERRDSRTIRPPLKRNNTDDSEVERRVAKLFKEIEFSVSDSVDETKINSQEYESNIRRVEAQTQTLNDQEIEKMTAVPSNLSVFPRRGILGPSSAATAPLTQRCATIGDVDHGPRVREHLQLARAATESIGTSTIAKSKEKKSRLAAFSSAFSHLSRRAHSTDTQVTPSPAKAKYTPRRLLVHLGLSEDTGVNYDVKSDEVKAVPTPYENVVSEKN